MNCLWDIMLIGINKYFLHSQMTSCAMRYDMIYRGGWQPCPYPLGSKEMDTGAMQAVEQI